MTHLPGWYADPEEPRFLRWWDGNSWTEHRCVPQESSPPGAQTSTAPLVQPHPQIPATPPRRRTTAALFAAALTMLAIAGGLTVWGMALNGQSHALTPQIQKTAQKDIELQKRLSEVQRQLHDLEEKLRLK